MSGKTDIDKEVLALLCSDMERRPALGVAPVQHKGDLRPHACPQPSQCRLSKGGCRVGRRRGDGQRS